MSLLVTPSLLCADHGSLGEAANFCEQWGADGIHIDIMDIDYAGDLGFTHRTAGALKTYSQLPLYLHFMVRDPIRYLELFSSISPASVTFQFEASPDAVQCLSLAQEMGIAVGLAIEPDTSVDEIKMFLPKCHSVTIMSVMPGKAGSQFRRDALGKIDQLRKLAPSLQIRVDGGVTAETAIEICSHGADLVVIGTALFASNEPEVFINNIKAKSEEIRKNDLFQ